MSVKDYLPDFESKNIKFDPANEHCTFSQTREANTVITRFSVIGFADPIFKLRDQFPRNSQHDIYGTLTDLTINQVEGPHWQASFTYSKERSDDDSEAGTGTLIGPKSSQLTVRMMSCPIETARKYRYNWNKNMYINYAWFRHRMNNSAQNAVWKITDIDDEHKRELTLTITQLLEWLYNNDGRIYRDNDGIKHHANFVDAIGLQDYIKWDEGTPSDYLPDEYFTNYMKGVTASPMQENDDGTGRFKIKKISQQCGITNRWHCYKKMTKPGVATFDYPVYEMQEVSKHISKKSAGWAIAEVAGRINNPKYGDFDITERMGGDWLCLGGTVNFSGRYWHSSRTYQHSPDGWDKDIYKEGQVSDK